MSDAGICLPEQEADALQMLSIRYSFPEWLIEKWLNAYGRENTLSILEACMAPAPLTVRVNTLQTTAEKLTVLLRQDHVAAHAARGCGRCFGFRSRGCDRAHQKPIRMGFSMCRIFPPSFAAKALDAQPGETVFDLCAAPGGKSFTVAERMRGEGSVCSFDLYPSRTALIEQGAARLGITSVYPAVADASCYNEAYGKADRVLCDVPCSGFGIVQRKTGNSL